MSKKLFIPIIFIIILYSIVTAFLYLYLLDRIEKIELKVDQSTSATENLQNKSGKVSEVIPSGCGDVCKQVVSDIVSKAISTVSSGTKVIEKTIVSPAKTKATSYIPMGSTYTTTSTDWYTLNDTEIYIDLINDYGTNATVSWEASLMVAHGNGQAFARLWDDTNKIAVNGSELTTINNASYSLVSSGNVPLWRGRNLYIVQIKSLNSFDVSITGAKIKISN
jgi:hypothetical protein